MSSAGLSRRISAQSETSGDRVGRAAERLDRVRQQHTRNPHCTQTYIRYLELQVEYLRAELRVRGQAV